VHFVRRLSRSDSNCLRVGYLILGLVRFWPKKSDMSSGSVTDNDRGQLSQEEWNTCVLYSCAK
jgi:hypothetical protein